MNETDIELKLLANEPIFIEGAGEILFPTARHVISLGESYYSQLLSNLLINRNNLQNPEQFDNISDFELMCLYCHFNESFSDVTFNGLRLFFKESEIVLEDIDKPKVDGVPSCFIRIGDPLDNRRVDESNFKTIQGIIAKANFLSLENKKEKEFNPANEKAKEIIDMIMKGRKERHNIQSKKSINLHGIIAGLSWKPNGINIKEIFDLTIYQIYMGYFVTQNIDSHYFTLTGIYTGNINAKDIDMSELNWAKNLEKN